MSDTVEDSPSPVHGGTGDDSPLIGERGGVRGNLGAIVLPRSLKFVVTGQEVCDYAFPCPEM
jgi:hypothetical protein